MRSTTVRLFHGKSLDAWFISGFEEKDDADDNKEDDADDSEDDSEDESEDSDNEDEADDDAEDEGEDSEAGLKSALKKERDNAKAATKTAKKLEKELKKFRKAEEEAANADKGEVTVATEKAKKAEDKVAALASKLLDQAVENAVTKVARTLGFKDPDDVMAALARTKFKGLDIEQDDDDPADIEIDEDSIKTTLKALAKKKPHWLGSDDDEEEGTGTPSGSKFSGSRKLPKAKTEEAYREKYPALRR